MTGPSLAWLLGQLEAVVEVFSRDDFEVEFVDDDGGGLRPR